MLMGNKCMVTNICLQQGICESHISIHVHVHVHISKENSCMGYLKMCLTWIISTFYDGRWGVARGGCA